MASSIRLRTFGGIDDKRIVLSNSTPARVFSIGTDWTQLRIATRLSITNSGADITGTPRLAIGVCSGTLNKFGNVSTTHFVGLINDCPFIKIIGSAPAGYRFWDSGSGSNFPRPGKRVGTTTTFGTRYSDGFRLWDASTANRTLLFVDITKGSPNYSVHIFSRFTDSSSDVSSAEFIANAESSSPALTNHGFLTAQTVAVNEATDGILNAVNLTWDKTVAEIEISDVAIVRFA